METPFKTFLTLETQLSKLLEKLQMVNAEAYRQMIKFISKCDSEIIGGLCKYIDNKLMEKRVMYKIVKAKIPELISEELNDNHMHSSDEDNE
jgi:hypothetical protein